MITHDAPFTIRKAAPGDEHQLGDLNRAFNGTSPPSDHIRRSLESRPEVVFVAEEENALIGFVALHLMHSFCYDAPWVEITEAYVAPSSRRNGVGTALLQHGLRMAKELGAAQVWLRTGQDNHAAQRMYQRAGFEVTSEVVCRHFLSAHIP